MSDQTGARASLWRSLAGGVGVAASLSAFVPHASAVGTVTSGWWTTAPVALAPDIEADEVLVATALDAARPLSYAAFSFALETGEVPTSLVLTVGDGLALTEGAAFALCPLLTPASAAAGAPAAEGPGFDCTVALIAGTPVDDGSAFTFDLTMLAPAGSLDVAVVATTPLTRVIFSRPDATALTVNEAAPVQEEAAPAPDSPPATVAPSTPAGSGGSTPTPTRPTATIPAVVPGSASPSPALPASAVAAQQPVAPVPLDEAPPWLVASLLPVVAVVVAGGLWIWAGQPRALAPALRTGGARP
jgi:hypothetical protein